MKFLACRSAVLEDDLRSQWRDRVGLSPTSRTIAWRGGQYTSRRRPAIVPPVTATENYPQRAWTLPDTATEVLLVRHGASQAAVAGEEAALTA